MRLAELFLSLAAFGSLLSLPQSAVDRRNETRQPRLEHVIGRAAFQGFNGDLFSHRARNEDKWCLRGVFPGKAQGFMAIETRQGIVRKNQSWRTMLELVQKL